MASVFSHGELRLYLLSLLAEAPRHGYDLMQALAERTGGTYTPSAGTGYPRLAKLEEEGLVTKSAEGRKTVYAITPAGRAELDGRADELDGIEAGLSDSVRMIAEEVRGSVREAMRSLRAELAAAARDGRTGAGASRGAGAASGSGSEDAYAAGSGAGSGSANSGSAGAASANTAGPTGDSRAGSRAELHRADAVVNDFRARVRSELRGHVARGGTLPPRRHRNPGGIARRGAPHPEGLPAPLSPSAPPPHGGTDAVRRADA